MNCALAEEKKSFPRALIRARQQPSRAGDPKGPQLSSGLGQATRLSGLFWSSRADQRLRYRFPLGVSEGTRALF